MTKKLIFGLISLIIILVISVIYVYPQLVQKTPAVSTVFNQQNHNNLNTKTTQRSPSYTDISKKNEKSLTQLIQVEDVADYPSEKLVYEKNAPIYVTFYSHNEDTWIAKVNTKQNYIKYRKGLLDRAELLHSYNINWDWQSDQPVIEAMLKFEDDPVLLEQTNGMNILKYLDSIGVSFDPHVHINNLADVAYLIEQLGVKASSVIGGTKIFECGTEYLGFLKWDDWHDNAQINENSYVYGSDYPDYKWKPGILSDPAFGGHFYDDWNSGVWRPGNKEKFYSHSPNNDIIYIGEGYPHDTLLLGREHASGSTVYSTNLQYIKELSNKIKNGEVPTGTKDGKKFMYTASIHFRDTNVVTDGGQNVNTIEGLKTVLETLKKMEEKDEVIIMDYEQVANIWAEEYNEVPWRYDLFDFSFYDEVKQDTKKECTLKAPTIRKR